MEFRETLLAAQRNQQQKSSENSYYKARFDPPKKEKEAKPKDRLSANIQKFLAKRDEEEKQKKLETQRKRDELLAMRDPKALRKIQKTLKVIKSANKSVLQDAIDRDHTAITLNGPEQPDQDDYGYESQEAAAFYQKMMQKYSKLPDEPKFPTSNQNVKKDLKGTMERVKHALQHEEEPVPHKRRRRTAENGDRDNSPPTRYEPEKEKKRDEKSDKPKVRKPLPPPMDFNQLIKLAEQKKAVPVEVVTKKVAAEPEPERLMTKKQKREYEEEMARRQRRQERIEAEKSGKKAPKEEKPERESKPEGFGRIPKLSDKNTNSQRHDSPKSSSDRDRDRDRGAGEKERAEKVQREKDRARADKEKAEREKERIDKEIKRLEKLKAERERIDRDIDRLNKDRERLDKTASKLDRPDRSKNVDRPIEKSKANEQSAKKIDLKSQNTYRIDKNSNEKKFVVPKNGERPVNGHSSKIVPKPQAGAPVRSDKDKLALARQRALYEAKMNGHAKPENGKRPPENSKQRRPDDKRPGSSGNQPPQKAKPVANSFDFDRHVNSLRKKEPERGRPASQHDRRRPDHKKPQRRLDSDSEYDSEMDDFIDDGDENMDYSSHIKEIFGYDKSKYRFEDDTDDPRMESSFVQQQREEYISKKIGIMEDLEDMRMEAMEKKKKKKRQISDSD